MFQICLHLLKGYPLTGSAGPACLLQPSSQIQYYTYTPSWPTQHIYVSLWLTQYVSRSHVTFAALHQSLCFVCWIQSVCFVCWMIPDRLSCCQSRCLHEHSTLLKGVVSACYVLKVMLPLSQPTCMCSFQRSWSCTYQGLEATQYGFRVYKLHSQLPDQGCTRALLSQCLCGGANVLC